MTANSTAAPPDRDPTQIRRVLFSSYLGSVVEFYDFLLYGIAASLVFGQVFFANLDPVLGTIASFGTLATGYIARPLGGIIFGHFGDRVGRKSMLVITMSIMGFASTLIGLLPTYGQIGVAAPILLVCLRIVQGIAVGGEWGGAALMSLEHSTKNRRGFSASVTNMGGPSGALLATLVMTACSTMPEASFMSWGWRIPFLLSAGLVGLGLMIRLRVHESPVFAAARAAEAERVANGITIEKPSAPLVEVLRRYPKNVLLAAFGGAGAFVIQGLLATFAITLAVGGGADRTVVLLVHGLGSFLHIFTIPLFAALSDRVGRRPVMISGALGAAVLAYPIFQMLASGNEKLVLAAFLLGNPLVQAAMYGPLAAFISEMFGTNSRYTGASLGYQLGTTLGAGLAPLSAATLLAFGGGDPVWVSAMVATICLISALAIYFTRESYRDDIDLNEGGSLDGADSDSKTCQSQAGAYEAGVGFRGAGS
ncbi:MFS transporter [Rhodococcus sp. IEGM 1379]|uniref:MFS transporter n=1 Tax=Rhodococcus sp. IEGM 1379 TaxID=3047086 RepID=UPI0024B80390|nr:MFS transporter [Rhodococcus sp. IEGM 1379]MDI9917305.1 MFS transporter [Rhodococcus sp. IEGM 1379]